MKQLPIQFTKQGFNHEQVRREGDVAIYRRAPASGAYQHHFEVVRIESHNGYTIAGVHCPPSETYPTPEQWGSRGWTYNDAESANAKFSELVAKEAE